MADISQITLPSGTTYDIKDATARSAIEALGSYAYFIGVTTTVLTDGSTTRTITVNGSSVTANTGGIATYGSKEFIWNGTAWQEFGDLDALGDLAFADSAYTYYTPRGSISLTNSSQTFTVSPSASGTATYTPSGDITAGTISVSTAGSTTTIKNPTAVTVAKTLETASPSSTAPANAITYYSVSGEVLSLYQIGYTTGDSITTTNVAVKTGDASYTSTNPTFSGTGVRLITEDISIPTSATFTGTSATITVVSEYS